MSLRKLKDRDHFIIWVLIILLLAAFLLYAFYSEIKTENDFQRHNEREHHQKG
jgi:hypothetical protein